MTVFYIIIGILLLLIGIIDFIWTTLWPQGGAGPMTNRLSIWIWKAMRKISGDRSKILSISGPIILTVTLLSWIVLLWMGWTLIFAGSATSFSDTQDSLPASWIERIYYAGYLIFTLGNGDYSPQEGIWQFVSILAAATGLIIITLSVTYLLSVLNAVAQKQSFAESISGLGKTAGDIVKSSWNGKDFHDIDLLLNTFASQLSTLTSQHNAYPILNFYHADKTKDALPVSVALLDETLTIYCFGIREDVRPNELLLKAARASVNNYLETLRSAHIEQSENLPPAPDLALLREAGLPTLSDDIFQKSLEDLEERRKNLLGIVSENAREWPGKQ